jgi:sterol desaturase/sphingolipid hydroxylase (fatty acid hydroxylase superfamily)
MRYALAAMGARGLQKAPKPTSCRMFETPLIQYFSRIHPASPFAFWLPVLFGLSAYELHRGVSLGRLALLMIAGWVCWSATEYALHRFVFHWIGRKPWQRRFHFVLHGVHHDFPQDAKRLVFPLGVSIPIGLAFFLAMDAAFAREVAIALFCGFGVGYLLYDGIHYFTHHLPAKSRIGKFLKRYHMVHHHTGVHGMWGVSQPLWDYVFGSQRDLREASGKAAGELG